MSRFIVENMGEILQEWESFARTLSPTAALMDSQTLRDHAEPMLLAIAKDIETFQSSGEQRRKSKGLGEAFNGVETAAATHGLLRQREGFDLTALVAEFRALRATVLRLWVAKRCYGDPGSVYEMTRFNEAIDQALAESVITYSAELAKARDIFLAILGHDLRSPLSALASALHIVSKPAGDEVRAKALAAGTNSVSAMSAMISDLLEYTRTRLGRGIPVNPAKANLESICRIAINEVSHIHPNTGFRCESSGRLDGIFDIARLHQVVSNLLNNAVVHGRQGAPVSLILRGDADSLTMRVTNHGPVIAPELLQSIFDPLFQLPAGSSNSRPSTNVGLGLFIAREIVLAHGGTIVASSSAREGTTLTVELPRVPGKRRFDLAE